MILDSRFFMRLVLFFAIGLSAHAFDDFDTEYGVWFLIIAAFSALALIAGW